MPTTSASNHRGNDARRPNVVVVVLDDVGFAEIGCFGSSIATPAIDMIAERGVLYRNFHVTPMCSPTRACLLTGRNANAVGMGGITDLAYEHPGYSGVIPRSAAMLPRHLRDAGYATFAVGKWHLAPHADCTPAGPFDRWPLGQGFDRFYGFIGHSTDQWRPQLVRDNSFVGQPRTPEDGYHLTNDLTTEAIDMISSQQAAAPDRPFFMYFATGAMHTPHQAPKSYVDAYRGAFDHGWDEERARRFDRQLRLGILPEGAVNSERAPWIRAWEEYSERDQGILARQMELYAGFLTHTDEQVGRLVTYLQRSGLWDDTIFVVTSDNGASGEAPEGFPALPGASAPLPDLARFGAPGTFQHYASGWAWAGVTPFRFWKTYSWLGGVRVPLVAHLPAFVTESGGVRHQFAHAIDLAPTILDIVNVEPPTVIDGVQQQDFDGVSLLTTLESPDADEVHTRQYFEMRASRSIYDDGWKATNDRLHALESSFTSENQDLGDERWALFNLAEDFSEVRDLASEEPERLANLIAAWEKESRRNNVNPENDDQQWSSNRGDRPPMSFSTWPRARYCAAPSSAPVEIVDPVSSRHYRIEVSFTESLEDPLRWSPGARGPVLSIHYRAGSTVVRPHLSLAIDDGFLVAGAFGGDILAAGAAEEGADIALKLPLTACKSEVLLEFMRLGPDRATVTLSSGDATVSGQLTMREHPRDVVWPAVLYVGRSSDGTERLDDALIAGVTLSDLSKSG